MKLNKSTNKIPDSLKEKMRNIFLNYDVSKNIDKTQINSEQYKIPEKQQEVQPQQTPINLTSLKREIIKPLQLYVNEKIQNISLAGNKNTNNLYKKYITNNSYNKNMNTNTNINQIDSRSTNKAVNQTDSRTTNKAVNIDYKTLFAPSQTTQQKLLNEFYNNKIDIKNITNKTSTIPALKNGGVVKEPTVAYLHENEAVVPLKQSSEFKTLIQSMNKETVKNISKNENVKNTTDMRSYSSKSVSNTNNVSKYESNDKKEQNTNVVNAPITISPSGGSSSPASEIGKPKIPLVYGGSVSKDVLFVKTASTPRWRKDMG
jgi:hypothetical protein